MDEWAIDLFLFWFDSTTWCTPTVGDEVPNLVIDEPKVYLSYSTCVEVRKKTEEAMHSV